MSDEYSRHHIERFRRQLIKEAGRFSFQTEQPPLPYFGNVQPSRPWPSMLVVDFAMTKTVDPVVLVMINGFLQDFDPHKELLVPVKDISVSEKPVDRAKRWIGEVLRNERLANTGVYESHGMQSVSWDFTHCDIYHNLRYLASLAAFMGIKRIGVITEPGLAYSIPTIVGDGIRVKMLRGVWHQSERDQAMQTLHKWISSKTIRLVDNTPLLHNLRKVIAVTDGDKVKAGEANPAVHVAATMCLSLRTDESGQLYFPEGDLV